ncbi:MAG: DPP IV N-terminal domain-containing protein [Lewinellaceae bacterium]|nr:DPP IV N-terminal domain-containing protein [Lewinellaceae bacterium]
MKLNFARLGLSIALPCLLLLSPLCLAAQQKLTMSDAILKGRTVLAPANLKQLQWIPGTTQFTHAVGNKIVRVQANNQKTDTLDVLTGINEGLVAFGVPALTGLPALTWVDADNLSFQSEKEIFTYSFSQGLQRKNRYPADAENVDIHAKTFNAAYTRNDDLWINAGGKELGVAQSEAKGIVYGKSVHREEFGIYKGTFWSNSGRHLAFYRMDESMVTEYPIYVLDSMPAQVREVRYPFAGSKSHHVTLGVFDTQTGQKIYLQTGEPAEQYLTNVAWTPDDKYILIAVVNREQNHMWLKQFDAATGAFVKTIFEETNDKWVEPEKPPVFLPGSNDQFLWQSERDGYNHLYLCNLSGMEQRQISKGAMPVTNFYGFDTKGENCFYQLADESGLNRYVYSAQLKTGTVRRLSNEDGIHNGLISSNGAWVLDVFSSNEIPRLVYLQSVARPQERQIIFGAKNPLDGYQLGLTRLVKLPSPGGPMLNARMILPPDFVASNQYPALVYVYNGPHVQMVTNGWLAGGELWMHHMAQEGYIVFVLDGRGSANRGQAFESAIHRRAGDSEMEDQLAGVNFLKTQGFVDPKRIGIYGWSYGGFMTTSLMSRPEAGGVFRCGVAGGPVIDWSMYEIMYTERYMDSPKENPQGYAKSNLFNYVDNLSGRLLMIHGSSDDVVLWQHSLRYIRECVRKGKQIDYFVYPEHLHNVMGGDRVHLFEKLKRFLMKTCGMWMFRDHDLVERLRGL